MRVIAGTAKGRILKTPRAGHLRPTSDKVKGAIFSLLISLEADFSRVLDLYSGSGALGIESLSRGAQWCDFVEQAASPCTAIKENLAVTGFLDRAKVHNMPVRIAIRHAKGPYTLILADPPYDDPQVSQLLDEIESAQIIAQNAIMALEHASRQEMPEHCGLLSLVLRRRYGDTTISIYQAEGGDS